MKVQLLVALSVVVVTARAGCPNQGFMEYLDLKKFMGTWYQYASYGSLFMKGINRCSMSTYELGNDGKTVKMVNNFILRGLNGHVRSDWTATASDASKPSGKLGLEIKLPGSYGNMPVVGKMSLPLMVLDTDYDSYAVLYVCKNIVVNTLEFGFIFTRKRAPSEAELATILQKADSALAKVGLKRSKMTVTRQEDCDTNSFTVDMATIGKTVGSMSKTAMSLSKLAPLALAFG